MCHTLNIIGMFLTYTFKTNVCCHSISPTTFQKNTICTFQMLPLNIPHMITFNKALLQTLNRLANTFEGKALNIKEIKGPIRIHDFSNLDIDVLSFVLTLARWKIHMRNFTQAICIDFQKWLLIIFKCFVFVSFYFMFCLCLFCGVSHLVGWLIDWLVFRLRLNTLFIKTRKKGPMKINGNLGNDYEEMIIDFSWFYWKYIS